MYMTLDKLHTTGEKLQTGVRSGDVLNMLLQRNNIERDGQLICIFHCFIKFAPPILFTHVHV